jgi:hypothetical protein
VAPESVRGVEPLDVVLDGAGAGGVVGIAQVALAVAHDEQAPDAGVVGARAQVGEIGGVLGAVLEELVDELARFEPVALAGDGREVEVVERAVEVLLVERPLGEGDPEEARAVVLLIVVVGGC